MRVFLSYRRADTTEFAGRCFEYFSGRFGRRSVFWDCRSIPPDREWLDIIRREIEASDVVLIIVGPRWDSILQERLNDEIDHVRFEVEYAARMHRPVVVVLIDGAATPREADLPQGLKFLGKQQVEAVERRSQTVRAFLLPGATGDLQLELVGRIPWHARIGLLRSHRSGGDDEHQEREYQRHQEPRRQLREQRPHDDVPVAASRAKR